MLPIELFGPLAISYVGLKLYEDFALDGISMLPIYGNILMKIIPIVALIIWVLASEIVDEKYQLRLGLALVFSLGGDILLEMNHLKHHFMLGLASFLIAHIFYAWTFWGKPSLSVLSVAGSLVVTATIFTLGSTFGEAAPADLALPVMAYCVVIGFMAVLSILCSKVPRRGLAIAGALIFALSDSTIATEKFLWGGHVAGCRAFIMFTYYLAQYLLVGGYVLPEDHLQRAARARARGYDYDDE